MNLQRLTLTSIALFLFLISCGKPSSSRRSNSAEISAKVEALLSQMTLDEKIGQMNQYNGFWNATGPAPSEGDAKNKYEHLRTGLVGSVLNVTGVDNARGMQKIVVEESRLGIPLIFAFDVIHGYATVSPIPLAESCSWDLEAIRRSAEVAAIEASAVGINWTFAPMVDISRDARWGRVMEGAGEDPYWGSLVAAARVRGFQGNDLSSYNSIVACAKHFAGYGFSESGRDYNTVDVSRTTLYNTILPPFRASLDAGVRTFMNAFNVLDGVPATGNSFLQRDLLKNKWNFDGFVVSDWGSITEMTTHGHTRDLSHAAEMAIRAGSDMDMESYAYVKHLKELVETGKVEEKLIDDAVRRILTVKYELGLFDDPYRYLDNKREDTLLNHPAHHAAALDIAKKSIVLLKNETNLLPLSTTQKGIAVIGALADDKTSPLGNWRLGAKDGTAVSVLEGLRKYTADFSYAKGVEVYTEAKDFLHEVKVNETDPSGIKEAVRAAKKAKVVVLVLGEHGYQSGEARSRATLGLPGLQQRLLEEVYAVNKNIVLVLMSGRPLALPWADENIPTIVQGWQLGSQSGNAIAEVLFGAYNPSGKLTMSVPRDVGQVPLYYNHLNTGRPDDKGDIVFWSHYIDMPNEPLYPFGYGLSYTEFTYTDLEVDASNPKGVKVKVNVKNTGDRDGEEVVQLYIRDKVAAVARPVKELKGYEKVALQAGYTTQVEFILTDEELGFYDHDGNFIIEKGEYEVMVGGNSRDVLSASFATK